MARLAKWALAYDTAVPTKHAGSIRVRWALVLSARRQPRLGGQSTALVCVFRLGVLSHLLFQGVIMEGLFIGFVLIFGAGIGVGAVVLLLTILADLGDD